MSVPVFALSHLPSLSCPVFKGVFVSCKVLKTRGSPGPFRGRWRCVWMSGVNAAIIWRPRALGGPWFCTLETSVQTTGWNREAFLLLLREDSPTARENSPSASAPTIRLSEAGEEEHPPGTPSNSSPWIKSNLLVKDQIWAGPRAETREGWKQDLRPPPVRVAILDLEVSCPDLSSTKPTRTHRTALEPVGTSLCQRHSQGPSTPSTLPSGQINPRSLLEPLNTLLV